MSELTAINRTDINISISFGAEEKAVAGESKPTVRDVASRPESPRGAEAITPSSGINVTLDSETQANAAVKKASDADIARISVPARVLDFFVSSLKNNQVSEPVVNKNSQQYINDPKFSMELQKIYTLLEPFMGEGKEEFKKSIEKMFSTVANATQNVSGEQTRAAMQKLSAVVSQSVTMTTTAGGEIQISSSISVSVEISVVDGKVKAVEKKQTDPLVVDLNGNGIELTSSENGVKFDIDGDGVKEQTAAPENGDALLALDRNNNGVIDDGRELFGDQNGAKNGFAELKKFDDNNDNVIDKNDKVFDQLKVVKLSNNGLQEITSARNAGIVKIDLSKIEKSNDKINGNVISHKGFVYGKDGSSRTIAEALFENFSL